MIQLACPGCPGCPDILKTKIKKFSLRARVWDSAPGVCLKGPVFRRLSPVPTLRKQPGQPGQPGQTLTANDLTSGQHQSPATFRNRPCPISAHSNARRAAGIQPSSGANKPPPGRRHARRAAFRRPFRMSHQPAFRPEHRTPGTAPRRTRRAKGARERLSAACVRYSRRLRL
jgi:hypothetical protein